MVPMSIDESMPLESPITDANRVMTRRLLVPIFFLLCLATIWISLSDHALSPRSEGRYASVSMEMLDGGDWLVPHLLGRPHLTKPPLIYWLQASCLRVLGHNEMAMRLPSAVAGSLT